MASGFTTAAKTSDEPSENFGKLFRRMAVLGGIRLGKCYGSLQSDILVLVGKVVVYLHQLRINA